MIKNRIILKNQLRNKELTYGAWTASSDPTIAELFSTILQPKFVAVDLEHSTISLEASKNIFTVIQANGCCALPRLSSSLDNVEIRRLMDAGADGIIAPAVNNKHELENIINAMKYPPLGRRGYGISRAQGYGENFNDYADTWNDSSILIIIIETIEGVEHIDELVSNDMVDGILIGEYDLSGSLNMPGKLTDIKVQEAFNTILKCCHKYNKSCGILLSEVNEAILKNAKQKANFIVLSTDILILSQWATITRTLIY
jgi:2-dehydro-3-deoxyglucarate aldolase